MQFFILILTFSFYASSLSYAQIADSVTSFAQVDTQNEAFEDDEIEDEAFTDDEIEDEEFADDEIEDEAFEDDDEQDLMDDEQDLMDDEIGVNVNDSNPLYFDFDLGIPVTFLPHSSLWRAYKDADWHYDSLRVATSMTIDRFRFELGYLTANYDEGEPDVDSFDGKKIVASKSKMTLAQKEVLVFWLRNDPSRVSFIGGGSVFLTVDEKISMEYTSGNQSQSITTRERDKARGYKLVVGGKDIDSSLKTTFSYTSVFIETKTGKRYDLGGFAFTFSLSFSGL